jgi:vacuolar-type H+-ATPase subunit I/STV1
MIVMSEEFQATTPKGLWLLVVLPPIIGAISMEASFVLVRQSCAAQHNVALYLVTLAAMVLTAANATVAYVIWKRAGVIWPTEAVDLATRIRFIAVVGILSSLMSFLLIVAQGIATVQLSPCQL